MSFSMAAGPHKRIRIWGRARLGQSRHPAERRLLLPRRLLARHGDQYFYQVRPGQGPGQIRSNQTRPVQTDANTIAPSWLCLPASESSVYPVAANNVQSSRWTQLTLQNLSFFILIQVPVHDHSNGSKLQPRGQEGRMIAADFHKVSGHPCLEFSTLALKCHWTNCPLS